MIPDPFFHRKRKILKHNEIENKSYLEGAGAKMAWVEPVAFGLYLFLLLEENAEK